MAYASSLCAFGLALALTAPAASERYRPASNAMGQPDLEGVWSYNSLTRMERPEAYSAVVITEAEARKVTPPPLIPPDATGQDETETYDAEGLDLARIGGEIRTAWIVDPPDGRLPFSAEGRARANTAPRFDGPETRSNQERCLVLPNVGPPMAPAIYNNNLQIVQTRDHVVFLMEMNHEARIIPLGARVHGPVTRWLGDSVGWWEGDTLVVETTGLAPTQGLRSSPAGRLYLSPQAVITERLKRLAALQDLSAATPAAALAECRRLHARTEPRVIEAQAPVVILPDAISPELCARVLQYWQDGEKRAGTVARSGDSYAYDSGVKQRQDVLVTDDALMGELMRAVNWRVVPAIQRAFNCDVAQAEAFRIGCYPAGAGYFRRHRDNSNANTSHRKFAISINLNEDYVGGELVFPEFGRMRYRPPARGAVIFSCSLLHEALDVTEGERFAVFSFFSDAAGAARVAERLRREQATAAAAGRGSGRSPA
jgi:predicted 2-oxoglutarate/Fe(II)-dependent dioxygenase YbiX